ncbi:hypothetical protein KAI04_00910 [Candidatus Pacearchaeota archaeon]|nr:hypothetical protein [Candidatus Pacearchaeota archaeon]
MVIKNYLENIKDSLFGVNYYQIFRRGSNKSATYLKSRGTIEIAVSDDFELKKISKKELDRELKVRKEVSLLSKH